jgi:hypothetical protein
MSSGQIGKFFRVATESRGDREERVGGRPTFPKLTPQQASRVTARMRKLAVISVITPVAWVGGELLVWRFVSDPRAAAALRLFCFVLIPAGLLAGMSALLTRTKYQTRQAWWMAVAGTSLCSLLVLAAFLRIGYLGTSGHRNRTPKLSDAPQTP